MRKFSLLIALFLLSASPAFCAWAITNYCVGATSCSFSGSLNNPSTVWVVQQSQLFAGACAAPIATGLTFTSVTSGTGVIQSLYPNNTCMDVFYAQNTSTTSSETFTAASISYSYLLQAFEVTGGSAGNAVDAVNSISNQNGTGGANSLTGAAVTPNHNGDFILAAWMTHAAAPTVGTVPNTWIMVNGASLNRSQYFIQTTAAAITPTAGDSANPEYYAEITVASSLVSSLHIRHSAKVE